MIEYKVSELFQEYEQLILPTIRKSNEISFHAGTTRPWESKLGGCPYLEQESDYPLDREGKPMMFLAQINLSDLIEMVDLPKKGLLQFYIHHDDCYGYDENCLVRYIEEFITEEEQLIKENPYFQTYKDDLPFDCEGKMTFELREMPISASCELFNNIFNGVTFQTEQEEKMFDEFDASGSRIGGYPYFIQNDPEFYEDKDEDVLLLQLDIDDECGIMFGDSGNCNFFIKREALMNRDFSKVEYDWQCC